MLSPNTRNLKSKHKARRLRNDMSVSERVLWGHIRRKQIGFTFRRQFAIGRYVLDFYCPEAMLCVEVDGPQHKETKGIKTLRIPSIALFTHGSPEAARFIEQIRSVCEESTGRKDWQT